MTTTRSPWSPGGSAVLAIGAFAVLVLLARAAGEPPTALPIDADPAQFSGARARAVLARILGDGRPHPVGSAAHADVLDRVVAELRAVGLEPAVQESLVVGRAGVVTHVRNVVATIPGRIDAPRIALTAHHDSVAAGPGAADDGAGVAAAIECARALRAGEPLAHTLVIAITDGEEVDLSGACALVREHPEVRDVRAVLNMEARGTSGLAYLFQTGPGVGDALARFSGFADRPATSSIAALVYEKLPNDTDLSVFLAAGWTGLNFAFIGDFRRYHTPHDDLEHLDLRSLQHLGAGALAGLRALDELDLALPHDQRPARVWHDVLGRGVLGWPREWSLPLAVAALILVAFAARRVRAPIRALAWGAAGAALGVVVSALILWGFAYLQSRVHAAGDPWFAALDAWNLVAPLVGLFGAAVGAVLVRARGAKPEHALLGVWMGFAIAAVLVAAIEPAACLLFVAPALVAGATLALLRASAAHASAVHESAVHASAPHESAVHASAPHESAVHASALHESAVHASAVHASAVHASGLRLALATLIPAAACAVFWLPFLLGVEVALGFAAGFVPGALAGSAAIPLVPLIAAARPRRTAIALGTLVIVAFVVLWKLPDRTLAAPIWTNTAHVQTDDAASWAIATYGAEMPDLAANTSTETARLLPWARWLPTAEVATAPRHAEPPPHAEVSVLDSSDVHRRLRLKITSRRGATNFVLGFPAGAVEVSSIRSGDLVARGNLPSGSPFTFVGMGPEGVEIELVQLDRGPWHFDLADARSGIPGELVRPFAAHPLRVPRGRGDVSIVATTFAP